MDFCYQRAEKIDVLRQDFAPRVYKYHMLYLLRLLFYIASQISSLFSFSMMLLKAFDTPRRVTPPISATSTAILKMLNFDGHRAGHRLYQEATSHVRVASLSSTFFCRV